MIKKANNRMIQLSQDSICKANKIMPCYYDSFRFHRIQNKQFASNILQAFSWLFVCNLTQNLGIFCIICKARGCINNTCAFQMAHIRSTWCRSFVILKLKSLIYYLEHTEIAEHRQSLKLVYCLSSDDSFRKRPDTWILNSFQVQNSFEIFETGTPICKN